MLHDNRIWLFVLGIVAGAIVMIGALATAPRANATGHFAHSPMQNEVLQK